MKALVLFASLSIFFVTTGNVCAQQWEKLTKTADSLVEKGQYKPAYEQYQRALNQAEVEFGKSHINYAQTVAWLGSQLSLLGEYESSRKTMLRADSLMRQASGPVSEQRADLLERLGLLYRTTNKFPQAEAAVMEALQIWEKISGRTSKSYAYSLGVLGAVYLSARDYTKAATFLSEAMTLQATLYGNESNVYAATANNLSLVYSQAGDYDRAEPLLIETCRIRERLVGRTHPSMASSLNNLAGLYRELGDYDKAIPLYKEVIQVWEKRSPGVQNHAVALNNLAYCYGETKEYAQADTLYNQALAMIDAKVGKENAQYGNFLNNRAGMNLKLGRTLAAQRMYQEAIGYVAKSIGTTSEHYAGLVTNLARCHTILGNYAVADSLLTAALNTHRRVEDHKSSFLLATTLNQKALLYFCQNRTTDARSLVAESESLLHQELTKNFLYLPARQRQTLLSRRNSEYWVYFSILSKEPQQSAPAEIAYNSSLFLKNLLLNEQTNLSAVLSRSGNPAVKAALDSLTTVKNGLSIQYAKPVAQRQGVDSLENRAERLEKQLARQSADFRKAQRTLQLRWQDVRDALKPGDAAVEFVSFPYHNGRKMTDSTVYMALVLRSGDAHPSLVPLCNEAQLNQLLQQKPTDGQTFAATLYRSFDSSLDPDQLSKADSLYALVWQPIDQLLQHVRRVYVAPAGRLHQLAFAALPYRSQQTRAAGTSPKTGRYLSDRYELRLVGSTRSVAIPAPEVSYRSLTSARLYGGIRYEADSTTLLKNRDTTLVARRSDPLRGLTRGTTWEFLAGSQREIEQVGRVLGKRATVLTGSQATEESLKALSGQSPAVLHVATHGFFFPDAKQTGDNVFRASADPLLRSGIVLAGANHAWRGGKPVPGVEDGILTAYEVANLNLTGTQVVALSACETGLGDIQGSEGVFGLQRAFKMAGVNYVLMSLWQVADQPTSVFMETFYRNWKKHQTIRTAFSKTQQQMRRRYPPAVWAAFVLLE